MAGNQAGQKKEKIMQIIISIQGFKDNVQHIAGLIAGTFGRGNSVAATLAKEGIYQWFPYRMIVVKK